MPLSSPETRAPEKILLVDDVPENLAVLSASLEPQGYEIFTASNSQTALKIAARAQPDLILLDVLMPDHDGFETCRRLKLDPLTAAIPVIFISARTETESLVAGFRAGGVDYVIKPFQAEEVNSRVTTHLRIARLTRELSGKNHSLEERTAELTREIERREKVERALENVDARLNALTEIEASKWGLEGVVGSSPQMQRLIADVERLRQFPNTTVLVTGESGTGKELIARAVHFGSPRSRAPFVPVNCVAIPAELAESILFGHVKGAFTGAISDRKGCFELAHGGTLFLDEIGDMPVSLQVKLLRVLEDGMVTPVGASEGRKTDVRVVAATNADLSQRIAAGTFRQDLYFRLARYNIKTPPLREHLEDVPELARHFLRTFAAEMGFKPPPLAPSALSALSIHAYPGNARELRNIIERGLIQSSGAAIEAEHLGLALKPAMKAPITEETRDAIVASLPLNLAEAEDQLIQRALQISGGNIANAARLLGVHRTRIYRKLATEDPAELPAQP
jgi:DNA-binding NtrC family response regulator